MDYVHLFIFPENIQTFSFFLNILISNYGSPLLFNEYRISLNRNFELFTPESLLWIVSAHHKYHKLFFLIL